VEELLNDRCRRSGLERNEKIPVKGDGKEKKRLKMSGVGVKEGGSDEDSEK